MQGMRFLAWTSHLYPKTPPTSTVQIIDSISCAILTQLQNPARSPQSRRIFLALALLMPRWLWPEPPRPEGTTLPAHSRPRLVQARAQLFRDGDLDALLAHLAPDEEDCPEPPAPPRTPGVLQQSDCHRLLQAGKQGRLTTAWKQLFSCGIAPANDATAALLRAKWLPAPLFPEELRGRYSTPGVAKAHLTEEAIQQACRKLTRGSAMDALGWSHEAWTKLHQLPHGKVLLQELLLLYCTGELGHDAEDLLNASLVVPLHKGASGTALRPTAVPTTHRKVFAKVVVSNFREPLQKAAGKEQHAAMCPQGTIRMAQKIQHHLRRGAGDTVYIRTDIRNAFNEVSRQSALQALERAHPELGPLQHAWLHRPSTAVMPAIKGRRQTLLTHQGIPQGDPLSSLAFTLVLAEPLNSVQTLPDDTVLACPPAVAVEYLRAWRDALAMVGLTLNPDKLQIWNPHDLRLPEALLAAYPAAQVTCAGFKVCGLPLDQADQTDPHATPMGDWTFTEAFLDEAREATNRRLRILATFVQTLGPQTEALHVALRIARVNLLSRHVHVYRFCDRTLLHRWTATLDHDLQTWLANLSDIPLHTPQALVVLHTPVGQGGLGFLTRLCHQYEAALHFL